jgi:hypothetical protein
MRVIRDDGMVCIIESNEDTVNFYNKSQLSSL